MLALLDLPDELLLLIALQCDDVADVARFARTCTALHTLITHTDHFWSLMLARHFNVHSHSEGDGARAHVHTHARARGCGRAHARGSPSAGASSSAAVDHRALFRERCERLEWAVPQYAAQQLRVSPDGETVDVWQPPHTTLAAYTVQVLPSRGLSAFRVRVHMPFAYSYHVGLVAFDADDGFKWVKPDPPPGRLRAFVHDECGAGEFVHPIEECCGSYSHPVHEREPVFVPAAWSCGRAGAAATAYGWVSRQWVTMVIDADRGRVYYSLGETGVFLIAFDDERLAYLRNLRAYVTLVNQGAWARIERVRVTDALRARLRALDTEYVKVSRAGK